jgi:hypothetical protein
MAANDRWDLIQRLTGLFISALHTALNTLALPPVQKMIIKQT